jgi:hypothetical protein
MKIWHTGWSKYPPQGGLALSEFVFLKIKNPRQSRLNLIEPEARIFYTRIKVLPKGEKDYERVIDFMINTPTQIPSAQVAGVVGPTPPPPPPETVVVAPGPDYLWVGGSWLWLGSRWAWRTGYWHRPVHPYYRRWR